mmetsp:Transcript_54145/g.150249  ORF Transcript_54145/g.150249 Transcript_54145/m.150249 type:complete len:158 (-) Transcript_54145:91-564(-)
MPSPGGSSFLPSSSQLARERFNRSIYTAKTAIGECRLDVGHLLPADDRHAPIRHYRSYGEWFEAGRKESLASAPLATVATSPCWPYGQNVTKLYQTMDKSHTLKIDNRVVEKVQAYIPLRTGSLPDLHSSRHGARRNVERTDEQSYRSSRSSRGCER